MDDASLNEKFAIGSEVRFTSLTVGITLIEVNTVHASASVSLMGGQVLTWHPKSQVEPVLWISKLDQFVHGRPIRGGVPICWPWFGAHPSDSSLPGHGYARVVPWQVISTGIDAASVVTIELALIDLDMDTKLRPSDWSELVDLSVIIRIGEKLEVSLTTKNNSSSEVRVGEAFHTYFYISDIRYVQVLGLDECEYADLTDGGRRRKQSGPIIFNSELGRIFLNCDKVSIIQDREFDRAIQVSGFGSKSIAVWNPWVEASNKIPDLGSEGWRKMVCVETANALEDITLIKPKQHHTMTAIYSVAKLP
jgi:glucose-6-phosphate 1-epimerase